MHCKLFRLGLQNRMNTRIYEKEPRYSILIDTYYCKKFGVIDIFETFREQD